MAFLAMGISVIQMSDEAWRFALADPNFKAALDAGLADTKAGRTIPWSFIRTQDVDGTSGYEALREALVKALGEEAADIAVYKVAHSLSDQGFVVTPLPRKP